ncbi:amidohydrolase family protein [Thermodesulfobacteriota bacterium]
MITDVHNHYLPEKIARAYGAEPGKAVTVVENGIPKRRVGDSHYILAERLKAMDAAGVLLQLLSCPVGWQGSPQECRSLNDNLYEIQNQYPERFNGLASIPIGYEEKEIISEIHRTINELKLKGFTICAQPGGMPLDEKKLWPIYKEIEAIGAGVFIHPSPIPPGFDALTGHDLHRVIGREFELVTAVSRVIYGKVLDEFPKIKLVFSHFGGGIANLTERTDPKYKPWYEMRKLSRDYGEYLNMLYFDTAGFAGGMRAFRSALEVLGSSNLLFGSDYPMDFIQGDQIKKYVDNLKAFLPEHDYQKIMADNATRVFNLS